ncbi:hypothetical protein LshimejAT787_1303690 [Lyophyllum shimeji]|uniref:Uncharacterized protein n=1 Tax=Lyophyllum shimeji TaxID=47721 RepID=A0A9P3PWW5_LYOSH|nr:hypothetical protein LshimejAT787_1303690 [Lyophyllum shimeji]
MPPSNDDLIAQFLEDPARAITSYRYTEANRTQEVLYYCEGRFRKQFEVFRSAEVQKNAKLNHWFGRHLIAEVAFVLAEIGSAVAGHFPIRVPPVTRFLGNHYYRGVRDDPSVFMTHELLRLLEQPLPAGSPERAAESYFLDCRSNITDLVLGHRTPETLPPVFLTPDQPLPPMDKETVLQHIRSQEESFEDALLRKTRRVAAARELYLEIRQMTADDAAPAPAPAAAPVAAPDAAATATANPTGAAAGTAADTNMDVDRDAQLADSTASSICSPVTAMDMDEPSLLDEMAGDLPAPQATCAGSSALEMWFTPETEEVPTPAINMRFTPEPGESFEKTADKAAMHIRFTPEPEEHPCGLQSSAIVATAARSSLVDQRFTPQPVDLPAATPIPAGQHESPRPLAIEQRFTPEPEEQPHASPAAETSDTLRPLSNPVEQSYASPYTADAFLSLPAHFFEASSDSEVSEDESIVSSDGERSGPLSSASDSSGWDE